MPDVASRDGSRIHYRLRGDGPSVVLLHPNHATASSWIELGWFDLLASLGFRGISLDARGFGGSEPVCGPESIAPGSSTDDIAAVLDALEVEAAHLCGFSLGAAAALRFAVDRPDRVKSLVLGGLGVGPLAQMGLCLADAPEAARRDALRQLEGVLRTASGSEAVYFGAVSQVIARATLRRVTGADLRAPALGVAGDRDPFQGLALYALLRDGGASIRIEAIAEVGHGACFLHPRFRQSAAEFWASVPVGETERYA